MQRKTLCPEAAAAPDNRMGRQRRRLSFRTTPLFGRRRWGGGDRIRASFGPAKPYDLYAYRPYGQPVRGLPCHGFALSRVCSAVCLHGLVVIARGKHPIPSRTRP